MHDMSRLRDESGFQDARVASGGSPRKFQHLIRDEHAYLIERLGDVKNTRILTMGCATGGVTPFARLGSWTLGIDISSVAVKELSKSISEENLNENAHVALMDCENLALAGNSFDTVLFFGVLHHLDIERTMMESYRVLKPGGESINV